MALTAPIGRASFPNVFKPVDAFDTGNLRFEITMLYHKEDVDIGVIRRAIAAVVEEEGWDAGEWVNPIKDGDKIFEKKGYDGYKDHWAVAFKSKNRPQIVDKAMKEIADDGTFYAGCYARVSFTANAYSVANDGVNLYLGNIQMTGKGEPFVARTDAADDFDIIESDDDDMYGDEEDFLS